MMCKKNNKKLLRDFHIPNIGILQWFYSANRKNAEASNNDNEMRNFGIRFYFEASRAGTKYTSVVIENELSQHIKHNNDEVDFYFEVNENKKLASILVGLKSSNKKDAFKIAYELLYSLLSSLAFFFQRPFKVWKIEIYDKSHQITYIAKQPTLNKPITLINPISSFQKIPMGSLFSIFREGMSSDDVSYRFISFFKIYEAWKSEKYSKIYFGRTCEDKPNIVITRNILHGSYNEKFHKPFLNKSISENKIYKNLLHFRNYLAHPFLDRNVEPSYYNFDLLETAEEIEAMSNLIERIVTEILYIELKFLAESEPQFKRLLEIYHL